LPEASKSEFDEFLAKNKITIPGKHSGEEAAFNVANQESAWQFLELVGGIFKGKKYTIHVESESYKLEIVKEKIESFRKNKAAIVDTATKNVEKK